MLRDRRDQIVARWQSAVQAYLHQRQSPIDGELRDSLPVFLDRLAVLLDREQPTPGPELIEIAEAHGRARFDQQLNVTEIVMEYRLLRQVLFEEFADVFGGVIPAEGVLAVDALVDATVAHAVSAFATVARSQLRAAIDAEARFVTFLSHDLRNRLNAVTLIMSLLANSLRDRPEFAEQVGDIDAIERGVSETVQAMERVLEAERLRKTTGPIQLADTDLRQLADEVVRELRPAAERKGLKLENHVPAGATARTDRQLLTLVLFNLVGNAVKFSQAGIVQVSGALVAGGGWSMAVSDQGPGITLDQQQRIFQPFVRGETHGQRGAGLGLSIASRATELLGGRLAVESELEKGSTFRIFLTQ